MLTVLGPRPAVSWVSVLPGEYSLTPTQRLVLYVLACLVRIGDDGRPVADTSTREVARTLGRQHTAVARALAALSSPTPHRPALIHVRRGAGRRPGLYELLTHLPLPQVDAPELTVDGKRPAARWYTGVVGPMLQPAEQLLLVVMSLDGYTRRDGRIIPQAPAARLAAWCGMAPSNVRTLLSRLSEADPDGYYGRPRPAMLARPYMRSRRHGVELIDPLDPAAAVDGAPVVTPERRPASSRAAAALDVRDELREAAHPAYAESWPAIARSRHLAAHVETAQGNGWQADTLTAAAELDQQPPAWVKSRAGFYLTRLGEAAATRPRPVSTLPPPCGQCDPQRQVTHYRDDGSPYVVRCPRCHPKRRQASA